jgi:hypothetical protein
MNHRIYYSEKELRKDTWKKRRFPTVRLESLLLSSLIDAHKGSEVITINITGALKAKEPEDIELFVHVEVELVVLLCERNTEFQLDKKGVLYLKCVKALYGHLETAKLFYDDLDASLMQRMGFVRNAYDTCIYNKRTKEGSVTIRTHVDDLKVSSRASKQLEKEYRI